MGSICVFAAMMDAETSYAELSKGSLKAASMEHGLQTTAIYWEGQLNSYKGVFGMPTYGQKWSWKLVDDQIRSFWGLDNCDVAKTPYVFYGDRKPAGEVSRADVFAAVMKSAFSVDLDYKLSRA